MNGGQFDVIIVGAGATGAPLAARLSDDPALRVLLLEAGPDYQTIEDFPEEIRSATSMGTAFPGNPLNWNFLAELSPGLTFSVSRGKIIGGSTSINGTIFERARPTDCDRWVAMGNTEWSYEKLIPYYKRIENDRTYGATELHGGNGPIPVSRASTLLPLAAAFLAACEEIGYPKEDDMNSGSLPGYGRLPMNSLGGLRYNTAITYLNPIRDRKNLTVRGLAFVRKVVFEGNTAVGVEVESNGDRKTVRGKEIILAAGAIKSPHLLLLSGIGPREELEAIGIPVVHELLGVGKNFADHPDLRLSWRPKRTIRSEKDLFQVSLNFTAQDSPYVGDLEVLPFMKSLGSAYRGQSGIRTILRILGRPISTIRGFRGLSVRHILREILHQDDLGFLVILLQEESRGQISIMSADPNVDPKIEYRYLSTAFDRSRMREGVRAAVAILDTGAFEDVFDGLTELDRKTLGDNDALDRFIRDHVITAIHACSSCRMGDHDDPDAVVDQYGRVHGTERLRVADVSILPSTPTVGVACTAILMGERMAEFVASDLKHSCE